MKWSEPSEAGPLRAAWEGLREALAELRGELGRAWSYRRTAQIQRATGPVLAEPELRLWPAWAHDAVHAPAPGVMCSRCGGSTWWSERPPDRCHGWRCARCHPNTLGGPETVTVNTRPAAVRP